MNSSEDKIKAILIIEVLGKPKEHLVQTLEKISEDISKEKGVELIEKKIREPVELKERKDLFTTFAELEIEVESMLYFTILIFKYMPAHVEIISPELIAMHNTGWNDVFNELVRRLHGYDEVARIMQFQNRELQQKLAKYETKHPCGDDCSCEHNHEEEKCSCENEECKEEPKEKSSKKKVSKKK